MKTPTNKDIVVTASTNEGTLNKTSYTFTENGSFTFVAIDEAGNKTEKTVTIANIDKVPPIITIKPYSTAWTNKDVVISAEVDKGTLNKTSHTFTKNSSFEFVATDAAGNVTKKTVSVSNIDKTPPTSPIVKRVEHRLVISPGTDYESGIDKNIYSINGGEWVVLTGDIDLSDFPDGNHTIKVKAIDIATNETEVIFNFITEYEKIKEEVGDELDETIIDDEIDLDDLEDRLDELEEIIGDLPDGDDKDKLQDELDKLRERLQKEADKRLKEAIQAVELAEATRREPYIQRAKDKVAKLKEGPDKEALEDRIRAIEYIDTEAVLLEEATKAVELAEATRRNVHIQDAKEKVSKLKNGPDKTALENRIKAIEHVDQGSIDFKDAELAVKLAEATKREPYVGKAKAKVRLLTSGSEKEQLEQRLYEIEKVLNQNNEAVLKNAERIVSLAEKLKRESNLLSARDAINRLKPSEEKTSFLIRLEKVAKEIEGKELTDEDVAIIKAIYYVELAETYDYEFMIRKAMEEVEKLPEGQDKQSLINRLNNLIK